MHYNSFYLIQRGSFRDPEGEYNTILSGRNVALIDPDYMGASEFEWGAIPRSYTRIFANMTKYSLHVTDIKTVGDIPLCLFCNDDNYENIVAEIKDYLKSTTDTKKVKDYVLKEPSYMEYHFIENDKFDDLAYLQHLRKTNFWWCIDNTSYGDWMAFPGLSRRQKAFKSVIKKDYESIWVPKSAEEKKKFIAESNR